MSSTRTAVLRLSMEHRIFSVVDNVVQRWSFWMSFIRSTFLASLCSGCLPARAGTVS